MSARSGCGGSWRTAGWTCSRYGGNSRTGPCTRCACPDGLLPVLVDATYWLPYAVLAASVPHAGRALPIHWRAFRRDLAGETEPSQHHLEVGFLRECLERVPVESTPVVIGDRGFGRASLCHWLHSGGWHFVLRVTADVWLCHPRYAGLARALPLRPGQRVWLEGVRYRQDGVVTVNVLAVWRRGGQEPWLLVTNLSDPALVERLYRRRMQIEHGSATGSTTSGCACPSVAWCRARGGSAAW